MRSRNILTADEIGRIEAKTAAAERLTSAQLRVAVVKPSWLGIQRKARKLFEKHGLADTAARNAVLLVADLRSREIAIYGDEGVSNAVGQDFWDEVRDAMVEEFAAGRPAQALSTGVRLVGEKLSELFPPDDAHGDEVENAVIFG